MLQLVDDLLGRSILVPWVYKLIKLMGFGYRDTDYFLLKITAPFHGSP